MVEKTINKKCETNRMKKSKKVSHLCQILIKNLQQEVADFVVAYRTEICVLTYSRETNLPPILLRKGSANRIIESRSISASNSCQASLVNLLEIYKFLESSCAKKPSVPSVKTTFIITTSLKWLGGITLQVRHMLPYWVTK